VPIYRLRRPAVLEHAGDHPGDQQIIVDASDEDTIITRSYSGKPMRVKKNAWLF